MTRITSTPMVPSTDIPLRPWRTALSLAVGKVPMNFPGLPPGLGAKERAMVVAVLARRWPVIVRCLARVSFMQKAAWTVLTIASALAMTGVGNKLFPALEAHEGTRSLLLLASTLVFFVSTFAFIIKSFDGDDERVHGWPPTLVAMLSSLDCEAVARLPSSLRSLHGILFIMHPWWRVRVAGILLDACGIDDLVGMSRLTCMLQAAREQGGEHISITLTGDVDEMVCRVRDALQAHIATNNAVRNEQVRVDREALLEKTEILRRSAASVHISLDTPSQVSDPAKLGIVGIAKSGGV